MAENIIEAKSFRFAVDIVKLCRDLQNNKQEYIMSKQLLRAGTSIGANVAESQQAQSKADFVSKLSIALKESSEAKYWLRLLNTTEYIENDVYIALSQGCSELERILTRIIKSSKEEN
ncbi:MAG: four helix bundle protein [Ruminococcus sp.]|nr:four helix bundle protein [Ruminococcus sp.]MBQ9516376.1 four helix bundle protein [Ruminococcus sp.]